MNHSGIPGVEYIPVQVTQAQVAQRTGQTLSEVRKSERELSHKGYGYRLNHRVWMFAKPFYEDATWTPDAELHP